MDNLVKDLVELMSAVLAPAEETYCEACERFAEDLEAIATTRIIGCCSVTLEEAQANIALAAKSYNDCCNAVYNTMANSWMFGSRIAEKCPELWQQWQDGLITNRELIFKTIDKG